MPPPCNPTFDLLTLKMVSESRVMLATSVPILVFLGLSVLDLGPMYTTDDVRQHHRIMPPPRGHNNNCLDKLRCSHHYCHTDVFPVSSLTLLVWRQEGIWPVKSWVSVCW